MLLYNPTFHAIHKLDFTQSVTGAEADGEACLFFLRMHLAFRVNIGSKNVTSYIAEKVLYDVLIEEQKSGFGEALSKLINRETSAVPGLC